MRWAYVRTVAFVPVVDVSVHQGSIDFARMRAAGVAGVIIRATHGQTVDKNLRACVTGARSAGYRDRDLGFYTFINPKRGSAEACAQATVTEIGQALGHTRTLYMLDVEAYRQEPPNRGDAPVTGSAFATYLRRHIAEVRRLAPQMTIIAYSNTWFWDGAEGPNDRSLAAELEWIVPRYPTKKQPPEPSKWGDWIFSITDKKPQPPNGASWSGWQFSADGNRQGPTYGCQSTDLDLNIVQDEAWARWTGGSAPDPGPPLMGSGDVLTSGSDLRSADGRLELAHLDSGEVVVRQVVWSSATSGAPTSNLVMQPDGNLVLYAQDGQTARWSSGTHGHPGATLQADTDGIAVVAPDGARLWSSSS